MKRSKSTSQSPSAGKQALPERRSDCPVPCALDIIGDRWTLVVVRDLMLAGKTEYGELLRSPEGISTNILADRLARLQAADVIIKRPIDGKRNAYLLSERGIALTPLVLELMLWSHEQLGTGIPKKALANDRDSFIGQVQTHLRAKLEGTVPLSS